MEVPFNGNVSARLLEKLYKDKIFYYVGSSHYKHGDYKVKPCRLTTDKYGNIVWRFLDSLYGVLGNKWENVFDIYEVAKKECKRRNSLYKDGFYKVPFVDLPTLEKHKKEMIYIENSINKYLNGFENFLGIDFCDVSARGIQIRGHCKQIKGYTYGTQPTIKYDFSNVEDVIWEFIKMWGIVDTEENIKKEQKFIREGERYGWN